MKPTKVKYLEDTYPIDIRIGLLAAIIFFILIFLLVPRVEVKPYELTKSIETILIDTHLPIDIIEEPPVQKRPNILVPTENPDDADIGTIDPTVPSDNITITKPDVSLAPVKFWKVEIKPKLVRSFPPKYPPIAKELGQEGDCVVEVVVGTDGHVRAAKVVKSTGYELLDQSAIEAAMQYLFTPGIQRDNPVEVSMSIKIGFKLR
ncbi:MAG TPA: energy transducer TonB [bacterium (Candidatus Stahlbacteria)]|nr:energy transducer TonB [Candidatus Stahlbacteria bacterium]